MNLNKESKFKLRTTIPISKENTLDYFNQYIATFNQKKTIKEYSCSDGSLLILENSNEEEEKVYVELHCAINIDKKEKSISVSGKNWFLKFCNQYNSEIVFFNKKKKTILPASDGALTSAMFTSLAFLKAKKNLSKKS